MSRLTRLVPPLFIMIASFFVVLELLYYITSALGFDPPIDLRLSQPTFWRNFGMTLGLVYALIIHIGTLGLVLFLGTVGFFLLVFITRRSEFVTEETTHPAKALIIHAFGALGRVARIQGLGEVRGLLFEEEIPTTPVTRDQEFWQWILRNLDIERIPEPPEAWYPYEEIE